MTLTITVTPTMPSMNLTPLKLLHELSQLINDLTEKQANRPKQSYSDELIDVSIVASE